MAAERTPGGFGRTLRDARERRGISLRQIANATKISMSALEALERSDLSRLPGGIFSRAFVRAYAIEVGIDPDAAVQEFLSQSHSEPAASEQSTAGGVEDGEAVESDRRTASAFLKLLALSIPVAGFMLYFGMGERRAALDQPSGRMNPLPTAARTKPPAGAAATGGSLATHAGAGSADRVSTNSHPEATDAGRGAAEAAAGDRFAVGLFATARCWVTAIVDGKRAIEAELQPGERRQLDVGREMVLTAGNAGALTMTLDGAAARSLGKGGEPATVRVTSTNFREYLAVP